MTVYINEIRIDEIETIAYEDQGSNGTWLYMVHFNGEDEYIDFDDGDIVRIKK